jgi:hypothetical protein
MTPELPADQFAYLCNRRKVSGFTRASSANAEAFEQAVAEVAATTTRLLNDLPPRRQPPKTSPPLRRPAPFQLAP